MKAVRLHASGSVANYVYEDAPDPLAGAGEVLVRVKAVALNHLEAWAAKDPRKATFDPPRILGADVAGVVESAGTGATSACGNEVMLHPGVSCGACEACLGGDDNLCARYHLLGQG